MSVISSTGGVEVISTERSWGRSRRRGEAQGRSSRLDRRPEIPHHGLGEEAMQNQSGECSGRNSQDARSEGSGTPETNRRTSRGSACRTYHFGKLMGWLCKYVYCWVFFLGLIEGTVTAKVLSFRNRREKKDRTGESHPFREQTLPV
jgi:hypothetical protein